MQKLTLPARLAEERQELLSMFMCLMEERHSLSTDFGNGVSVLPCRLRHCYSLFFNITHAYIGTNCMRMVV